MKRIPLNALSKAVYKRLTDCLDTPVYDDIRDDATLPYISFGLFTCKDIGTKVNDLTEVGFGVDVWSDYQGRHEVNTIANEIITVMGAAPFGEIEDRYHVVSCEVDFFEAYNEDDYGYHATVSFIFKIQNMEE